MALFSNIRRTIGSNIALVGGALGLPEFGLSEKFRVSSPIGGNQQTNPVFGPRAQTPPPPPPPPKSSPQPVQKQPGGWYNGVQYWPPGQGPQQNQQQDPQQNQQQDQQLQQQFQSALAPNPEPPQIDYDALIAPALQALDEAVAPQQSAYTANVADIEAQTGAQKRQVGLTTSQAQREAVSSRERRGQEAESAIDEARRQYSQIQQGLQARYGGSTGTGRFASEIAATQTLRNIGQVRQNLANAISTIDDRLAQVQEIGKIQIQDTEDRTITLKQQAKAQLDQALGQIRLARGEIQSRKVELAQNAMQNYQQTVAQINAQNAAFKQNMALAQYQAEQQLAQARQKAQGLASQYSISNTDLGPLILNKTTGVTMPVTATGEQLGTTGGSSVRDERDEEIFGG